MSWINSNNAGPLRRIVNQSRIVSSTLECSVAKRGTYINITYFFDDYVNMCVNRELGRNPTRHHMGDKFLNQRPTDVGWHCFLHRSKIRRMDGLIRTSHKRVTKHNTALSDIMVGNLIKSWHFSTHSRINRERKEVQIHWWNSIKRRRWEWVSEDLSIRRRIKVDVWVVEIG